MDIDDSTARRTNEVVMPTHVRIEARRAVTDIDHVDFTEIHQVIEDLVNGPQRHRRHLDSNTIPDDVGRWV